MAHNVAQNNVVAVVAVLGYVWGRAVEPLLEPLSLSGAKFDLILLSDLVFNHAEVKFVLPVGPLLRTGDFSDVL